MNLWLPLLYYRISAKIYLFQFNGLNDSHFEDSEMYSIFKNSYQVYSRKNCTTSIPFMWSMWSRWFTVFDQFLVLEIKTSNFNSENRIRPMVINVGINCDSHVLGCMLVNNFLDVGEDKNFYVCWCILLCMLVKIPTCNSIHSHHTLSS